MTAVQISNELRDRLAALSPSVEGSSLYLLRAIELTVDSLQVNERLADGMAAVAQKLSQEIRQSQVVPERYLDADDEAINAIESGYKALEERLPGILRAKSSIDADGSLTADQRDLLHVAYQRYIDTLVTLIETSKDLRAAVITHDLAAEKQPDEWFDACDQLINSLHNSNP